MRFFIAGALAFLVAASLLPVATAAEAGVSVADNLFSPANVRVAVGDTVTWSSGGTRAGHNVREDHRIFYSGMQTDRLDFTVAFSAGTFHYFCENHGSRTRGMDGTVKVPARITAAPAGVPFTVRWATSATETGARFAVDYRIGSGRWTEWKVATRSLAQVFGSGGQPTPVLPGTSYGFRVRSLRGDVKSFWSPVASFTP